MNEIKEQDIIQAIENKELIAYYQPKYDALTSVLKGAEALVRWQKPEGSMVMPGSFIPILEQSDLILRVDWYILNEVCAFQRRQLDAGKPIVTISANFSRRHLQEKRFHERICEIVDSYQIPREKIEVELTESAMLERPTDIITTVDQIRNDGFSVAIDDFGSGFSSLSLMKDISANVLKIDRSLLSGNCENEKERIVLESIFDFAHRLKLTTVAEGVETREQLGFLRTCDCRLIQGFLFAKPMSEQAFIEVCEKKTQKEEMGDILQLQAATSATHLLLDAIFQLFPLVIMINLSRNSFYMMAYENFSRRSCPSTGTFTDLIAHGASTMHPQDRHAFAETFSIPSLMRAYQNGEKSVRLVTRQLGDDGVYRKVETVDYFVKNPAVDDVLVITFCQNIE